MDSSIPLTLIGIGALLALLIVFGGLAVTLDYRKKTRERELAHAERMKALELGRSLQDAAVVEAYATSSRAHGAAAIGVLVPIAMAGAAVGGTFILLTWGNGGNRLPHICVVWGVCGVVSLVTVVMSLAILARRGRLTADEDRSLLEKQTIPDNLAARIQEPS
jgi:hypothetical protein